MEGKAYAFFLPAQRFSAMSSSLVYLVPVAVAAVIVVLGMGLWNMLRGGDPTRSQSLMRWRVLLQMVELAVIMLVIYMSGR
jgi:hypothetical protein